MKPVSVCNRAALLLSGPPRRGIEQSASTRLPGYVLFSESSAVREPPLLHPYQADVGLTEANLDLRQWRFGWPPCLLRLIGLDSHE